MQFKNPAVIVGDTMEESPWAAFTDWFKISGFVFMICGFWIFTPPLIMGLSLYLCYVKFFAFAPAVLLYLAWYYYTKDWPESGCMPSEWFRKNTFFLRWACEYFNYRVVKTAELPPDRNYLIGSHPHGVVCIALGLAFAARPNPTEIYPGMTGWAVTLAGQFWWPLRRELIMLGGAGSASKKNFKWIYGQEKKGQSVITVIGGLNECLMTQPGKYHLKLKDRKGFIRIAITEGADLVPGFNFGENETYTPVTGICPKRLRNMQAHLINTFGFCFPFHMGRSLLGLPWGGLVPLKTRIESVIGAPIHVDKNENPTDEEVDRLHAIYCEKLIELFETHKANYGIRPEQRIILY